MLRHLRSEKWFGHGHNECPGRTQQWTRRQNRLTEQKLALLQPASYSQHGTHRSKVALRQLKQRGSVSTP